MSPRSTRVVDALGRAADWRLLGLLLERPRAGWLDEVRALAEASRDAGLRDAAARAADATEAAYLALIGPGGLASPREAAYVGWRDPAWLLAEVARFYDAFAFQPRAEDPFDHVAVEVGFVAYLFLKEAFALEAGDAEAVEATVAARERFVAEHVATIAGALVERLAPAAETPLACAARELAARVPPPPAPVVPAPEGDDAVGCGACGAVEQGDGGGRD